MTPTVFVLSSDQAMLNLIAGAIGPRLPIQASASLHELRKVIDAGAIHSVIVPLSAAVLGGHTARTLLAEVQDAVGSTPVYGLAAADCPERLQQLAARMLDACLMFPEGLGQLIELLRVEQDPVGDLAGLCSGRTYRALHGHTRSLLTFTPAMFEMIDELKVPAAHDVTVLLIGETGSGKTYLAQLIHELSARRDARFLTIACGALPPELIESELFGYVRGAFTGADRDKPGKFAAAGSGTLLLDEIDVLPLEQQAKLLRVIETGEYEPVGSNDTQVSQARLIVASNHDLSKLVDAGTFRKDLYYRLNMLSFRLPPLRERPWDIEFLARKFALDHARSYNIPLRHVGEDFLQALRRYDWPGNIRELENVVRRAVLYCRRGVLSAGDLPSSVRAVGSGPAPATSGSPVDAATLEARVDQVEQRIIEESLRRHNNRRTAAARELGISRVTLYNKMKKYGMLKV